MKYAKKLIAGVGSGLGLMLISVFLVIVLPVALVALAYFAAGHLYSTIWKRLRNDPRADLELDGLVFDNWQEASTKEEFVGAFKKVSGVIAKLGDAKQGEIDYDGLSIPNEMPADTKWVPLSLAQNLSSAHADIQLYFSFGAFYDEESKELTVSAEDSEDQCGGGWPYIVVRINKPDLHTERQITLKTYEDVWMAASFLRGKVKFTHDSQAWAYIPERKVWLVQYKADKSSYGLRADFTGRTAYEHGVNLFGSGLSSGKK